MGTNRLDARRQAGDFETPFTWGSPFQVWRLRFLQRGPGAPEVLIAGTFSEVPSAQDTPARKPRTLRVNGSEIIAGHKASRGDYSRHFLFFLFFIFLSIWFLLSSLKFSSCFLLKYSWFTVLCLF